MIKSFQSDFVFGLQGNKYQDFIDVVARPIIQNVIKTDDYEIISPDLHISFKDFENKRDVCSLLYASFLNDIVKKDDNVRFKKKICISLEHKQELTNQDYITKIGYVHNLNIERKFSFIRSSIDGNDGFPIYYGDFPDFERFPVGTVVKARGNVYANKFKVMEYEIGELDDLSFDLKWLRGILKRQEHNNFAIIETSFGGVIVSDNLIQDYDFNKVYDVECLAIEHYDIKKEGMVGRHLKFQLIKL